MTTHESPTGGRSRLVPTRVIVIGLVALVLVVGLVVLSMNVGVTNEGKRREATLNSQYLDNQNYLASCTTRIKQSAQVARAGTGALDRVLTDAVKGRYDEGSSAQVGQGQLFSAVVEAYPDLSGLSAQFSQVMTVVNGCRADYRGQQTRLLDMLRDYDGWRTGSLRTRTFGKEFPSDNLEARIGSKVARGDDARDQMFSIVTTEGTQETYESGSEEAEDPFAVASPS